MTTAHNEHTGASLTTAGKSSLEKYTQGFPLSGWEGTFGVKVEKVLEVKVNGIVLKSDEYEVSTDKTGFSVDFSKHFEKGPFTVMALDFHDGAL